ncbi:MAG: V-type ATP synthase subunit F [Clostridia bacterium]|nr:V-type ATP synthase subunit F [Clostridia bacterium]
MYKIGVLGDYDSICAFAALGLDTVSVETVKEAEDSLKNMALSDYGIIYVTEQYFKELESVTESYREALTPAIMPIPCVKGFLGVGKMRMKKFVEQAVGSDIIYND